MDISCFRIFGFFDPIRDQKNHMEYIWILETLILVNNLLNNLFHNRFFVLDREKNEI